MHASVVLGVGKGVLFREVSSVFLQKGSTVYTGQGTGFTSLYLHTATQNDYSSKRVQLEMAEREKEANAAELAGLATELVGLRQELEAAREAAALVGLN